MKAILSRRSTQVVGRRIADEVFLVPIRGTLADLRGIYALDPVSAFIWERLDGVTEVEEVARAVTGEFAVDLDTAIADVREFLGTLRGHGFVEDVA